LSSFKEHYTLSSHAVDPNDNVWPSIVARLMVETANHQMRDRKPTYDELFAEGKSYILIRLSIQMTGSLTKYEHADVETWTCPSKAATFIRCFRISVDGEERARGYSEWAVTNLKTDTLMKVSDVDISNYEHDEALDMNIPVHFRLPKDLEWEECDPHTVRYSMVDKNMHMNNTYYENMIWDRYPDAQDKVMTSFSIRFRAEAHLGATVRVYRSKFDEPVDDGCGAEESYYFHSMAGERTNTEVLISAKRIR